MNNVHPIFAPLLNHLSRATSPVDESLKAGMGTAIQQAYERGKAARGGDRNRNPYAMNIYQRAWFDGFDGIER